jgi:hypothetical protein
VASISGLGTVQFLSNEEIDQQADDKLLAERELTATPDNLASFGRTFFNSCKTAKLDIEQEFLRLIRQSAGEYDSIVMSAIKDAGMPEEFIRLVSRKERDVEGWLWDIFNPMGERTWDIVPEHVPILPPDLEESIDNHVKQSIMQHPDVQALLMQAQQTGQPVNSAAILDISKREAARLKDDANTHARRYAEERCGAMERIIQDQMKDGGYYEALFACIKDLSKLKSCVMKGPIPKRKQVLAGWKQVGGKWKPEVQMKIVPSFERVSPFDWYPVANSTGVHDGGGCELEHFNDPADLRKMIGVPGYKSDVIEQILTRYAGGFKETTPIAPERFLLEKQTTAGMYQDKGIDGVSIWTEIPGKMLKDWDIEEKVEDTEYYFCNVRMVDNMVYRAVINPDPIGRKPYHITSFIKSNDSQWGIAPGELAYDIQNICNNAIRALARNMAMASGPVIEINSAKLAEGESPDVWAHKVVVTDDKGMTGAPAVRYNVTPMISNELLNIFKEMKLELDSIIIPSFGQGSSLTKGGGKTAQGLAMIANAESRNLKVSVFNVDNDIQIPCIERLFIYNMLYSEDESIKGALKMKARGIAAQLMKENQHVRRGEFMVRALNPAIAPMLGEKGIAYLVRKDAEGLGLDVDQVIPNYDQIEASVSSSQQPPPDMQAGSAEAAQTAGPKSVGAGGIPLNQTNGSRA